MALRTFAVAAAAAASSASAADRPVMSTEFVADIVMSMPYIPMETPLKVTQTKEKQSISYYGGLQADYHMPEGTYQFVYNNSKRVCMFSPETSGPTMLQSGDDNITKSELGFLPDLSLYTQAADETVDGVHCQKWVFSQKHGNDGTMDDLISFYWAPTVNKPVRWHIHAREPTFGSHTDEYIMDFKSFETPGRVPVDLYLPVECQKPVHADVSIQLQSFLKAAQLRHGEAAGTLHFDAFLKEHGRSYAPKELAARREIFDKNLKLIQDLNDKHAGKATFRANQFLDMTKEEVLSFRGGKSGLSRAERRSPAHMEFVSEHRLLGASQTPKSFVWSEDVVGRVKDQAFCGSCWAFGAIMPVEAIMIIKNKKNVKLPEQFVVDCTWANGTGASGSNSGCNGGDSDIGILEVVRKYGGNIPTADVYGPYLSVNGDCHAGGEVGAKVTGWVDVKARDDQGLMDAIVNVGPVSIGIMVPPEMLYYDSGVLSVESCRNNATTIDHAVAVTGFGTDENGVDYWIVRNSWSTYWGDKGYIKIARGELDCCVSSEAGYPEVAATEQASIVV